MMKKIAGGFGSLVIALFLCGKASAYCHANAFGGGTAHTYGHTYHSNAYGGSTSHTYGEGTSHTNAYGGSTSHSYYGGTSHTNAYGGTTTGAHPQRITDTTRPLLWVTPNRGATTAATDHRLGLPPWVLWRAWLSAQLWLRLTPVPLLPTPTPLLLMPTRRPRTPMPSPQAGTPAPVMRWVQFMARYPRVVPHPACWAQPTMSAAIRGSSHLTARTECTTAWCRLHKENASSVYARSSTQNFASDQGEFK